MSHLETQEIKQKLAKLEAIESQFAEITKRNKSNESKSIEAIEKLYELGILADELIHAIKYELAVKNYSSLKLEYPNQKELLRNITKGQDTPSVKFYKQLNVLLEAVSEEEGNSSVLSVDFFDLHYDDLFDEFHSWFDVFSFYKNRIQVGPIISRSKLPSSLGPYFHELKDAYAFGLDKSAISLCRVIIEISIDDRLGNVNLYKTELADLKKRNNHDFCLQKKLALAKKYSILPEELEDKAQSVREIANQILHISSNETGVLKTDLLGIIKDTVQVVEYLYR